MLLVQGYLDFITYKMVATIMKTTFCKLKPKILNHRKYEIFLNNIFRDTLLEELSKVRIKTMMIDLITF